MTAKGRRWWLEPMGGPPPHTRLGRVLQVGLVYDADGKPLSGDEQRTAIRRRQADFYRRHRILFGCFVLAAVVVMTTNAVRVIVAVREGSLLRATLAAVLTVAATAALVVAVRVYRSGGRT